ncbi:MAG: hypothetical protein WCK42_05405 [Myxococcaceae bacterium]
MTIFWKRPLTAVALGALFVGAISCDKKDGKDGVDAAGGGGSSCTFAVDQKTQEFVLTCSNGTTSRTGISAYKQICFQQRSFIYNAENTAGILLPVAATTLIPNTDIKIVNQDGTFSSVSSGLRVSNLSADTICANFPVPKSGSLLYQVSQNNGSSVGTTRLVPVSFAQFQNSKDTSTTAAGKSANPIILPIQDSDTILSTHIVNLLANGGRGGYKSMLDLNAVDFVEMNGVANASNVYGDGVYGAWAINRSASATTWGQLTAAYLNGYLAATPGELRFLSKLPILKTPDVTGAGNWSPLTVTASSSSYAIGSTANSLNLFTASNTTIGGVVADCWPTVFAGTNLNVANQLAFIVNGTTRYTTTSAATATIPATCSGYTAGYTTGVAGGIVAAQVLTAPTTSVSLHSTGTYLLRYRDTAAPAASADLPVGIFGIYMQTVPVASNTAPAVSFSAGDGFSLYATTGTSVVLASDTSVTPAVASGVAQSLAVNTSTKWFVLGTGSNADPVYGFSGCTDDPNLQFTLSGYQVTYAFATAPVAFSVANATAAKREHLQMLMVKSDYGTDPTAYNATKAFVLREMALNGQVLEAAFDALTWPTGTAAMNLKLAELAVKSGVFCANSMNKVSMLTGVATGTSVTDRVSGHNVSYYPNVSACLGDPHQLVTLTNTGNGKGTTAAGDTGLATSYTAYTDGRGCVTFYDVAGLAGDAMTFKLGSSSTALDFGRPLKLE